MQAKTGDFSEFSRRSDLLADALHANLSDLPSIIGISQSLFWAYRSGKSPISSKSWGKLLDSEKRAGLQSVPKTKIVSDIGQAPYGSVAAPHGPVAQFAEWWKALPNSKRAEIATAVIEAFIVEAEKNT